MRLQRGLFKRERRRVPRLNTASLPDLIFTVLFFFMLVTHMREVDVKVKYEVPKGTELQKQGHKSAVAFIYIGRSKDMSANGQEDTFVMQLNDRIATLDDIKDFVKQQRSQMSAEDQARMTVSIKADKDVPMGMIADVKHELQKAFALRVNYSATEISEHR